MEGENDKAGSAQEGAAPAVVTVAVPDAPSRFIVVCEHASSDIPEDLDDLGLTAEARYSHIAWDPHAGDIARELARFLDARCVSSTISRLVYDCNRPPEALDAMPQESEIFAVPGNAGLSAAERERRVVTYYRPFEQAVAETLSTQGRDAILVTVHTFTPVYRGKRRDVEIGILHDADSRLADAMLSVAVRHTRRKTRRNDPYGPADGVTHTLKRHGLANGVLNVMIELRNDLFEAPGSATAEAHMLAGWITEAVALCERKVA